MPNAESYVRQADSPKALLKWTFLGMQLPRMVPCLKHLSIHLVGAGLAWAELTLDEPRLVWEEAILFAHLHIRL